MRRAAIVAEVAAVKARTGDRQPYQPAREAEILRSLLGRHDQRLSKRLIIRLWREILGATTRLQGEFRVALPRAEDAPEISTLAREHFGSEVVFSTQSSAALIISAVRESGAEVGVLPIPTLEEEQPWWPKLLQGDGTMARIVARLPFLERELDTGHDRVDAFVIGAFDRGKTRDDRSVVALECGAVTSRAAVYDAVAMADLQLGLHAIWETGAGAEESRWHLIDVKGYVSDPDEQLSEISLALGAGLRSVRLLGGYASPVKPETPTS